MTPQAIRNFEITMGDQKINFDNFNKKGSYLLKMMRGFQT